MKKFFWLFLLVVVSVGCKAQVNSDPFEGGVWFAEFPAGSDKLALIFTDGILIQITNQGNTDFFKYRIHENSIVVDDEVISDREEGKFTMIDKNKILINFDGMYLLFARQNRNDVKEKWYK